MNYVKEMRNDSVNLVSCKFKDKDGKICYTFKITHYTLSDIFRIPSEAVDEKYKNNIKEIEELFQNIYNQHKSNIKVYEVYGCRLKVKDVATEPDIWILDQLDYPYLYD